MNDFLKLAYEQGAQQALIDAGIVKQAQSSLETIGDYATPAIGTISPLAAGLISGATDPGEHPIRSGLAAGLGGTAGGLAGFLGGGLAGLGTGKLHALLTDAPEENSLRDFFTSAKTDKELMGQHAAIGAILAGLAGSGYGSHLGRDAGKDFSRTPRRIQIEK